MTGGELLYLRRLRSSRSLPTGEWWWLRSFLPFGAARASIRRLA